MYTYVCININRFTYVIPPRTPGGEVGRGDVEFDRNEEENPSPAYIHIICVY
jgi:hypothetical protein